MPSNIRLKNSSTSAAQLFFIAISLLLILHGQAASADWPGVDPKIVRTFDLGQCDEAWAPLWSSVKNRHPGSLSYLASLRMIPAEYPGEKSSDERTGNSLALGLYAAAYGDLDFLKASGPEWKEGAVNLWDITISIARIGLDAGLLKAGPATKLLFCQKSEKQCSIDAIHAGLVPSFDEFARSIESNVRRGHTIKCRRNPNFSR